MEPKADLRFPTQQELLFPLLEVLAENGPMQAKDACQAVAEKINLRPELRNVSVSYDDGRHHTNLFDRKTRWVRQNATIAQLIPKDAYRHLELVRRRPPCADHGPAWRRNLRFPG